MWKYLLNNYYVHDITDRITNDAREDEMNQNLEEVDTMVSEMKQMASDIANELTIQTKQLSRIQDQVLAKLLKKIILYMCIID